MSLAGSLVSGAVYAASVAAMYFLATPEVTGALSERQRQDFRVAALKTGAAPGARAYVSVRLVDLDKPAARTGVTFLLPDPVVDIPGGDLHRATVLESSPDSQLIRYDFGNTHSSVSRYRAYRDRIEPLSYRITFHPGIALWALLLLFPALVAGAVTNWVRRRAARRAAP